MVNKLIFDFDFGQTDRGMDICDSRVAFATEKQPKMAYSCDACIRD